MNFDDDMAERHDRILMELAESGLAVARRLSEAMLQAADVQELVQVGEAYHRASRGVRQTVALRARLAREARNPAPARTAQSSLAPKRAAAPEDVERPERLEDAERPERPDWYERDDAYENLGDVGRLLETQGLDSQAVQDAITAAVARIRRDIAAADSVLSSRADFGLAEDLAASSSASTGRPLTRQALLATSSPLRSDLRGPQGRRDRPKGPRLPRQSSA